MGSTHLTREIGDTHFISKDVDPERNRTSFMTIFDKEYPTSSMCSLSDGNLHVFFVDP
jgi:hypothetical protein